MRGMKGLHEDRLRYHTSKAKHSIAGEFTQPLSGLGDGFVDGDWRQYYRSSKGTTTSTYILYGAIDLDFGARKRRKRGKNWPVSQAMLSAHACFCIVSGKS